MSPKRLGQLTKIRQDPVKAEPILRDLFSTRKQLNAALGRLDDAASIARVPARNAPVRSGTASSDGRRTASPDVQQKP